MPQAQEIPPYSSLSPAGDAHCVLPRADELFIRPALPADTDTVRRMLARAYRAALPLHYEAETLRDALPLLSMPRPGLLTCGTYFVAEEDDDHVLAAGGWTDVSALGWAGRHGEGHVRHVATDPDFMRLGLGRRLMSKITRSASAAGIEVLHAQATLGSVPFFEAFGFETQARVDLRLPTGRLFPAVQMRWQA